MRADRAELKRRARQALKGNYGTAIGGLILFYIVYWVLAMAVEVVGVIVVMVGGLSAISVGETYYGMEFDSMAPVALMIVLWAVMYLVIGLVMYIMVPGLMRLFMNICKGETAKTTDIFWALQNKPMKFVGISLGFSLLLFVCSLPTMILSFAGTVTGDTMFVGIFVLVYTLVLMGFSIYASLTFPMFFYILVEDPKKSWIQALAESRRMMIGNRRRFLGLSFSFLGWMILGMMSFGLGMLWLMPYISCTTIFFYLDLQPQIETISPQTAWNPYVEGYEEPRQGEIVDFYPDRDNK